jgi:HAD superfamily hydrolase (TIGR01484 family)
MEPLEVLPPDALHNLRGVVFDMDDTLTTHGSLRADAYAALWSLRDAGLALALVTGRPLGWTDALAASFPIDVACGENGAGWALRRGGTVETGYFHDEVERSAQAEILARVRREVARAHPSVTLAGDQPARRCDLAFDVGERHHLDDGAILALCRTIEAAGARVLVSSVHAHVLVGAWDKASGARRAIADALAIDVEPERERWIFVGDSGNDASAFAYFPLSVGVANVRAHTHRLPVPPRYVTREERGAGFAELARAIVRARHG